MKPRRRRINGSRVAIRPGMKRSQVRRIAKRFRELNAVLDKIMVNAGEKFDLSCTKGCAHCCRQAVTISVPEAIAILEPILFDGYRAEWFLKGQVFKKIEEQAKRCISGKLDVQTWFDSLEECVFLEDDLCTIYETRPGTCRKHAVTSPPEICAPPREQLIAKINIENWFQATEYEVFRAARETGLTVQIVPMPVALAWGVTAIMKGAATLGRELRQNPIFRDDMAASVWWAMRFTSKDEFAKFKESLSEKGIEEVQDATIHDERGAGGSGEEGRKR